MIENFLKFIDDTHLFDKEEKILLAVSGGIDSVVMAALFDKAGLNFGIAHCNFALRGEESDADENFVKKIARRYKVDFHVNYFETKAFADSEGISTQMAARYLRYEWFEEVRKKEGYAYIATAHHQNDTLETILYNLTKGTGISGLHGILPKNGRIIRPLLFADKEMIRDYVATYQLTWREDSSNESTKYARNLIRHEVIPVLKQINPDLENTVHHTVERVRAVEDLFEQKVREVREDIIKNEKQEIFLDIDKIKGLSQPEIILFELVKPYNFNYTQVREMVKRMGNGSGKVFVSPTHRLNIDRTLLIITPKELKSFQSREVAVEDTEFENAFFKLGFKIFDNIDYQMSKDKNNASLDFDRLKFPLKVRKWKEGDWFCPLGMNKRKKLSDFMIDEKIPLTLKERVFVLTSGDSIV
ncbi:tRNA lysidine(34) synthetase TilS, partial [Xanthovirga aplysinae]|uniref:tRNA lysidine(34) synthetase TilS n=1 Tax=Xanthovirga aplysinae TaxID=2529853 RepID=UPI0012BBFD52